MEPSPGPNVTATAPACCNYESTHNATIHVCVHLTNSVTYREAIEHVCSYTEADKKQIYNQNTCLKTYYISPAYFRDQMYDIKTRTLVYKAERR